MNTAETDTMTQTLHTTGPRWVLQLTNERKRTLLFWVVPTKGEAECLARFETRSAGYNSEFPRGGGRTADRGWVSAVLCETDTEKLDEAVVDSLLRDDAHTFSDMITWGE